MENKKKVMVVDDNHELRNAVKNLLKADISLTKGLTALKNSILIGVPYEATRRANDQDNVDDLLNQLSNIYIDSAGLTIQEANQIFEFYKSPGGVKMLENNVEIQQKCVSTIHEWITSIIWTVLDNGEDKPNVKEPDD